LFILANLSPKQVNWWGGIWRGKPIGEDRYLATEWGIWSENSAFLR